MSKEYELTTIKDILEKVPVSRIEDCMKELTVLLKQAKAIKNIVEIAGNGSSPNLVCPDTFTWVDDQLGIIDLGIHAGGDEVLSVRTKI